MTYQGRTQTYVKQANQRVLLEILLKKGPLSRADLAKELSSSKPTVSKNVESLLVMGLIQEVGKADNKIGKKATLLDINSNYGYVFAIDLSKDTMKLVISNIKGFWCYYKDYPLEELTNIKEALESFLEISKDIKSLVQQIVIAYPGVVGYNDTYHLTNFKQKEEFLEDARQYIEKEFQMKPIIKNDVNLAVITEKNEGTYKQEKNIYYISGDIGIGSGIILNHHLFEGDRNAAGEIGFILPAGKGQATPLTLEERISIYVLLKRYQEATGKKLNYRMFKEKVQKEDVVAEALYQDVLEQLSVAISNISAILDIQTILVTGRLFQLKSAMLGELEDKINQVTPLKTKIRMATVEHSTLKGAVYIGIKKVVKQMIH